MNKYKRIINAWLIILILFPLVGLGLNYVFIVSAEKLPQKETLKNVTGHIEHYQKWDNGIEFRLDTFESSLFLRMRKIDPKVVSTFEYATMDDQFSVLLNNCNKHKENKESFCSIWMLKFNDEELVSYESVAGLVDSNRNRIKLLANVMVILGLSGFLFLTFLKNRLNKRKI